MKTGKKLALVLACATLTTALPIHAAALIGDLNGDGAVDAADAKKLAEYFAGYGHEIDSAAADVDIDGDVDRKDGMILSRYVNGWDGYEMPTEAEAAAAIYTKELDEEHIQTGTLTYEGETYEGMYVDNEIIVVVDEDVVGREYVEELVEPYGGTVVGQVPVVGFYQVEIEGEPTLEELEGIIDTVSGEENVESVYLNSVSEVEEDAYLPNDPFNLNHDVTENAWDNLWVNSSYTWHLRATNVPEAWDLVYGVNSNPSIKIGILDSLFDINHEDLENLTIQHYADTGVTANKYPDYAIHGTHVAGIIGAQQNNSKGVAGVALGAELVCRTTRMKNGLFGIQNYSSISDWVTDISTLIKMDCRIINMSQSNALDSKKKIAEQADRMEEVLKKYVEQKKKFLLVVSAGNDGDDNSHDVNYNSLVTKVDDPELVKRIIVVGNAIYDNNNYRDFADGFKRCDEPNISSSFIGGRVDVMAPGHIYSTIPTAAEHSDVSVNIGYDWKTGTSMASPFVAGVAALVWEANPDLSPEEVKEIIVSTANIEVTNCTPEMVNAEAAVQEAINRIESTIIASGTCGDNITWTLDEAGTLTLSGYGVTYDYGKTSGVNDQPWWSYKDNIEKIVISDGITGLGWYNFCHCTNLQEVEIADSLEKLGCGTFVACSSLEEIVLPDSITSIGWDVFFNCKKLSKIKISAKLEKFSSNVFYGCTSLEKAYFYGNAPSLYSSNIFDYTAEGFTIYYISGKTGWTTPTWNGYPTATFTP